MKTDTPATLYGVQGFAMRSSAGLEPKTWAKLRAGGATGTMSDIKGLIIYFFDPAPRDEFLAIFGGTSIRLDRTRTENVTDISKLRGVI